MEIGGWDTVYSDMNLIEQIKTLVEWPDAVVELEGVESYFYYKDAASKEAWDQDIGPDDTMIYFIVDKDCFTIVADKATTMKIREKFPPDKFPPDKILNYG